MSGRSLARRWVRAALLVSLLLIAAGAGYCHFLGYPAGQLYSRVPASAPSAKHESGGAKVGHGSGGINQPRAE